MIDISLSRAQAMLYMEMIKENTHDLIEYIQYELDHNIPHSEFEKIAQQNYVTNLENENKALRAQIDAKNLASDPDGLKPAKKAVKLKPKAPWGYKKDGTPKKRPGRAPGF